MKDDAYAALFDEGKSKDKALSEEKRLVSELRLRYEKANDMIIDISSNLSVRERELGELRASQVIFCIG